MILTKGRSESYKRRLQKVVGDAVERSGLSARQISIAVVGHDGLIRDIVAGRIPSADRVEALCEYLNVNLTPERERFGFSEAAAEFFRAQADEAEYPAIEALTEAGDLAVNVDFALSRRFLDEQGLRADELRVVRVPERDDDPRLPAGAFAIIRHQPDFKPNGKRCAFFRGHMTGLEVCKLYQVDASKLARPIATDEDGNDLDFFQRLTGFKMIGPVLMVFSKLDIQEDN